MASPTTRATDLLVLAAVRAGETLLRALPPATSLGLARVAGAAWRAVDGRRRFRIRENLRVALPERAGDPRFERTVFGNLLCVPVELLLGPRLLAGPRAFVRRCRLLGDWDLLRADVAAGRGGVVVTGHLGNWEVAGSVLCRVVPGARLVVRPLDVPGADARATSTRGGTDRVIGKRGAVREALRLLRDGGWVGILADQDAGRRGAFVPFFGLAASTSTAPYVLAARAGVPLYVGACLRRPGAAPRFDVHLRRLEAAEAGGTASASLPAVMARANAALEGWIRAAPDQYNWLHRRWKSRPRGEPRGPHLPAYARNPPA